MAHPVYRLRARLPGDAIRPLPWPPNSKTLAAIRIALDSPAHRRTRRLPARQGRDHDARRLHSIPVRRQDGGIGLRRARSSARRRRPHGGGVPCRRAGVVSHTLSDTLPTASAALARGLSSVSSTGCPRPPRDLAAAYRTPITRNPHGPS